MNEKPNIKIYLEAASRIERNISHYTCFAIRDAARHLGITNSFPLPSNYYNQYERWVQERNGGVLPNWWNSGKRHKRARMGALNGFIKACIKAGKKQ